ncbi:hypothetical protein O3P69_018125 [Scylla paramamosain]|uniref:Uncharacterized protein n=1 Tax=Scylla paramamosain TaxID=85552 RepID=A0AAW0THX3_SCYPA
MDTDCLQEEISVAPERTPAVSTSPELPRREDRDAGGTQHSTHQWNGKGEGGEISTASRIEAAKRSLEKAMNGDTTGRSTKDEEDFPSVSEVKALREAGLTSSPSPHFKSSYAKSLADSYRRASIPVVISSPKGQFYFKNDEFLSLSSRPVRRTDSSHEKYHSFSMNGDSKAVLAQNQEPQSLPPIIDSHELKKHLETEKSKGKSMHSFPDNGVFGRLLEQDVFVPHEKLQHIQEEVGGSLTIEDWNNLGSVSTSDGRKLVKLSDISALLRQQEQEGRTQNGHSQLTGSGKDSQVESLLVERGQLGDRVDQLCRVLADRDSTIQQLEEDLLRVRMECQRLMVDNRSLKSSVGPAASQTHPAGTDSSPQAEQSRHTYEAATRQLVDFLHTVNSTLNNASHLYPSHSPTISPTCSINSSASTTTTKTSSSVPAEAEDDPPYRLGRPSTPPVDAPASHSTPAHRRNAEAMKKAGSVWALPTHNHQHKKVSRAASTHCVATAASSYHSEPTAAAAASPGHERTRPLTTDFLASRARELLTSLKSLMRSDSVLKLNLEPKKSTSGRNRHSSSRSAKTDSTPTPDTEVPAKTPTIITNPQSDEAEGCRRPTTLSLPGGVVGRERTNTMQSETNASPTVSQNPDAVSTATTPPPRIGTGKTREDTLLPQTSAVNGNSQPLSLMVVGEHPCTSGDSRFSSLPIRNHLSRTLTDADQRLVWV